MNTDAAPNLMLEAEHSIDLLDLNYKILLHDNGSVLKQSFDKRKSASKTKLSHNDSVLVGLFEGSRQKLDPD